MDNHSTAEELFWEAKNALERLRDHLKGVVDSHASIIASDDQYDDPELWWSSPALDSANEAMDKLEDVYRGIENN